MATSRKLAATAKRIADTRCAPELDFNAAPPTSVDADAERAADFADLAQCLPDRPSAVDLNTAAYAPAARFTYEKASYLYEALTVEASRIKALNTKHRKFVRYDKEDPDGYANEGIATWETPFDVLRTLNNDSPEARFVAIEIFSITRWHQPFYTSLMHGEGCKAVHDHVVAAAKRIAVFLQSGSTDLFELISPAD